MIRFILLISVIACEQREPAPPDPPKPLDAQPAPVIDSAPKPDCKPPWELESNVRRAYTAMDPGYPHRNAIALWKATPPACRTGRWYLAAARLLDLSRDALEVDSIRLETAEGALAAALKQPDEVQVLRRVAEVSSYGRQVVLPSDACPRARAAAAVHQDDVHAQDAAHFVCARRAITDGDSTAAVAELAAMTDDGLSAGLELARAQAAVLRGEHVAAKRHAAKAIEIARKLNSRETFADSDAITRLAKQVK